MIVPRTITINDVDALLYTPSSEERPEHVGVFQGCTGSLPAITYLGRSITVRDIEDALLQYYEFRDIGFTTWQEFQGQLRNVWNGVFPILSQNLENVEDFTVTDAKETVKESISDEASTTGTSSNKAGFTNTPNQYLASPGTFNGLTSYQEASGEGEQHGNSSRTRELETDKGGNAFERWLELSAENRNIIYDFLNRFAWLFKTTYIIQ